MLEYFSKFAKAERPFGNPEEAWQKEQEDDGRQPDDAGNK
jgi:hypothetical protein